MAEWMVGREWRGISKCVTSIGVGLLVAVVLGIPTAHGADVTLSWNPSPSAGVVGYWVYYGEWSKAYTKRVDAGSGTSCLVKGLQDGVTYYFAMTARDAKGNESDFSEEVFFPGRNVAPLARVTASSQDIGAGSTALKAVDGYKIGYPVDQSKEWAAMRQLAGAWITLSWPDLQQVNRVVLYDRPNLTDQILSATIRFSDGSSLTLGPLANDGAPVTLRFPTKWTNEVTVYINSAKGYETGLAEIEVFTDPA